MGLEIAEGRKEEAEDKRRTLDDSLCPYWLCFLLGLYHLSFYIHFLLPAPYSRGGS